MSFTPLISIIVPVYNVEKYLSRCIDSILKQTYGNFELILIDDGSPDNSPAICDLYVQRDTRIKCFHKENEGVSSARNMGIEKATGNYVVFVDSDDWVKEFYLKKMIESLEGKDMLFYGADVCNSKGQVLYIMNLQKKDSISSSYIDVLNYLLGTEVFGHTWMMIVNRELVRIHNIRFQDNISIHEDFIFACECLGKAYNIAVCDETPYVYVQYESERQTLSSRLPANYESIALKRLSVFIQLVSEAGIFEVQKGLIQKMREFSYLGCIDVITRENLSLLEKIKRMKTLRVLFEITSPIHILAKRGFKQRVFQFLINTNNPYVILFFKWIVSKFK